MWEDLEHHKQVEDFKHSDRYLTEAMHQKEKEDLDSMNSLWHNVHIKVLRAEDLPKTDSMGWCDSYVRLIYGGLQLLDKEKAAPATDHIAETATPAWNTEFIIPVKVPVQYNRMELVLMDHNRIAQDQEIGRISLYVSDLLLMDEPDEAGKIASFSGRRWVTVYADEEGKPPMYRGRILLDLSVEKDQQRPILEKRPCAAAPPAEDAGSYELTCEVYEGCHLAGNHNRYQVDITWCHTLSVDDDRSAGGKFCHTITSPDTRNHITPFYERVVAQVHGLPRLLDPITNRPVPWSASQIPDILIYVRDKSRDHVIGYLRVPPSMLKRRTENFLHGEDLTILSDLWTDHPQPYCLPLKELEERHDEVSSFLMFRLSLKPLVGPIAVPQVSRLPFLPRQSYRLVANIYQAKYLASLEENGMSRPFATVQLMNSFMKFSPPAEPTLFPNWFQAKEIDVELPVDLRYAPNITLGVYHHRDGFFRIGARELFMGKCEIEASKATIKPSDPFWIPLTFEDQSYGEVLASFRLIPSNALPQNPINLDLSSEFNVWEEYGVDISALALRGGPLSQKFQEAKTSPNYDFECWGVTRTMSQDDIDALREQVILRIKRPINPIFFSSIIMRVRLGDELVGSTCIPIDSLLPGRQGWQNLISVLRRSPHRIARTTLGKWREYTVKQERLEEAKGAEAKSPLRGVKEPPSARLARKERASSVASNLGSAAGDLALNIQPPEEAKLPASERARRFEEKQAKASSNACKPRKVGPDGQEEVDPRTVRQVMCEAEKEEEHGAFETHWRVKCEYENLPIVNHPFKEFDVMVGKNEVHLTFLERAIEKTFKLFVFSKRPVAKLRGNFHVFSYKEAAVKGVVPPKDFDHALYKQDLPFAVRVYLLRGLQLSCKSTANCDSFIKLRVGKQEQKSQIIYGACNPDYYQCFQFDNITFPSVDTVLTLAAYDDNDPMGTRFIGETSITLEQRLYSRQWQSKTKPIERRFLFPDAITRMPQGMVELCVEIVPMNQSGVRGLDYLLEPPRRLPWELRVITWNTRNVTPKSVYHSEDECCLCEMCLPPNQSDIRLACKITGSPQAPSETDIHLRSIDGEGNFNWRHILNIDLPAPVPLSHLKVQIWNVNWSPDDCVAEAVIPLWGFFEYARRTHKKNPDQKVFTIPRQWVECTHPFTSDQGEVELEVELMPRELAKLPEYRASTGEDGWEASKNEHSRVLPAVKRPPSSFPWWRIDLQIWWRVRYCFMRSKWWILGFFVMLIVVLIVLSVLKNKLF
eukprot:TRINITY_DN5451_c0_g1_i6.p1 TRINITY_DN5451_c0_g1~~TRINITY_DN5451_c0_g1_i6.p1  ORF type:complete len:1341 (-),score=444.12 TRINITY_DN5451_c0_g1_i6:44-3847(-)